jgi:RNA polymerase sigma-70 factor (ECF subfamily)
LLDEHDQFALILGLREGSQDAWAKLYDHFSVDVWRYVGRVLGPNAAAIADVVQETFMDAARTARQFDSGRGTLWSWLVGIAHHRVSAHWRETRRQARLRGMAESGNVDARQLFDGHLEGNASGESCDTVDFVRSVLAQISSDYASLLTAKYLDDLSLGEMSVQFGSSVDAIKSKLARARQEFRSKFEFMAKVAEAPANPTVSKKRPMIEKQS